MKKFTLAVLFTLLLSFTITACKDNSFTTIITVHDDMTEPLILTTEFTVYPRDVEVINATLTNPTDDDLGYGHRYYLERKVDDEWEVVPYGEEEEKGFFYEHFAVLTANTEHENSYDLSGHFDLPLTAGIYRITYPGEQLEISDNHIEYALAFHSNEFTIE